MRLLAPAGNAPDPRALASLAQERPRRRSELKLSFPGRCLYYLMVATLHVLSLLPDFVLYPLGVLGGWLAFRLDRRHCQDWSQESRNSLSRDDAGRARADPARIVHQPRARRCGVRPPGRILSTAACCAGCATKGSNIWNEDEERYPDAASWCSARISAILNCWLRPTRCTAIKSAWFIIPSAFWPATP